MLDGIDGRCINAIRCLSVDQVNAAKSGHPGTPIGFAPAAYILFKEFLQFDPSDPLWINRDRFVLSNGHASPLIYSLLHLFGYNLSIDDLRQFRQLGSHTPGHPERDLSRGIEITTGALGQGIGSAVGMALASKCAAAQYPGVFTNKVICVVGDGCLQEGVSAEASSLAGRLKLNNLIVLYDDNGITIDGKTTISFTEDVARRYQAYGWQVLEVKNGNTGLEELRSVIGKAYTSLLSCPTLVIIKTTIGYGTSKQGTAAVHGAPLGESTRQFKEVIGVNPDLEFHVSDEVRNNFESIIAKKKAAHAKWITTVFERLAPDVRVAVERRFRGLEHRTLSELFAKADPEYEKIVAGNAGKRLASRQMSQQILDLLATHVLKDSMLIGSADLASSNLTKVSAFTAVADGFSKGSNYVNYGVREHAMATISNGIGAHGGFVSFDATFLMFFNYCCAGIRNGALSEVPAIHVFTHDSFFLGEDGGTHHPIETLAWIRSMPRLMDWRPCSIAEVYGVYLTALADDVKITIHGNGTGPQAKDPHTYPMSKLQHVVCLSRHALDDVPNSSARAVVKGAYSVHETGGLGTFATNITDGKHLILLSSGSEVGLCLKAADAIAKQVPEASVRVVSMPSYSLFNSQPLSEQNATLPCLTTAGVPCLSVEPYTYFGIKGKYAHKCISIEDFSFSGKPDDLARHFNITVSNIVEVAQAMLAQNANLPSPALVWMQ